MLTAYSCIVCRERVVPPSSNEPALPRLLPFAEGAQTDAIPFLLTDYLALADAAGRCVVPGKRGFIPDTAPTLLHQAGLHPASWFPIVTPKHSAFESFLGVPRRLRMLASAKGWKWLRGVGRSRALYAKANE